MESVIDLKHFSTLIKQARAASGNLISNCYLLPVHIQQHTMQRKLFAVDAGDGVCFLLDSGAFFTLYFYLPENPKIRVLPQSKPVIVNLVYKDANRSDSLRGMEDRWIESGFHRSKTYRRMLLQADNTEMTKTDPLAEGMAGFTLSLAESAQLDELMTLWRNTLDILSNPLPSREEMQHLLTTQQVMCMLDHDRHVVAALHLQIENKVGGIQHVAVEENHRRLGLAKEMLRYCFSNSANIKQYALWVEENNHPAIRLYSGLGFGFDGMFSNQLIMD